MTLPDPYRGHAQPSWDTRTLATLIAALGGVGGTAPATAGHHHDTTYAPSAKAYFTDVYMVGGTGPPISPAQTLGAGFIMLNLNTKTTDLTNSFNTSSHIYTVPATGTYFCQALIRLFDGGWTNDCNCGVGIHSSSVDGTWFAWNKVLPNNVGGSRVSIPYTRLANFTSGDQLRLYAFQDSGANRDLYSASMQIWRIG